MKCLKYLCVVILLGSPFAHLWAQTFEPCENVVADYDDDGKPAGSTYVPLDSWLYPALDRLHALGGVDILYLGMRPWTRLSMVHALEVESDNIDQYDDHSEACQIYQAIQRALKPDINRLDHPERGYAETESVYTRVLGISGLPLRDSYHLGQSIINDYGRPYQQGFNNLDGFSARAGSGRFAFYFRGEYQHAPGAAGYSPGLTSLLSNIDEIPIATNPMQDTIPTGPIGSQNPLRVVEVNASYLILNHEISFGKNDHWLGPAQGGSFAWSNNAENIYTFEIDRTEPLFIPLLSRLTGPFRYQFFVGSLKGHTDPNSPWVHAEKVSFKPTTNLEFGFERTVIWGGKDHVPITIHSFLRSFFSTDAGSAPEKFSRNDPGARFGTFDFSYRLPYLRQWLTLYTDSLVHDDVSPISAPRRAGIRPGLYLSHFPKYHQLDLRVEAADTDPPTSRSNGGQFLYWEQVQRQGYTNKGFIMGDWIGRESKGGQAWLTYHLSPSEQIQLEYRNAKAAKDFIPGGTTQNSFQISAVKRIGKEFELSGSIQGEHWKAPVYKPNSQTDFSTTVQFAWHPHE
jgi:Capsule assembly protein Wzi